MSANDNDRDGNTQRSPLAPLAAAAGFLMFTVMVSSELSQQEMPRKPRPAVAKTPELPCNPGRQLGRFEIEKCTPDGNSALIVSETTKPGRRVVDYYRFDTNQFCTSFNNATTPLCYDERTMNDAQKNMYETAKQEVVGLLPARKPG